MADTKLPITGGCLCGAVRFEVYEPPTAVGTCHCRMCQRHTGSAFAAVVRVRKAALRWTRAQPTMFRSSPIMERGYCPECGSTLISVHYETPPWKDYEKGDIGLAMGVFDDPYPYTPTFHYGIEHKLSWVANNDGIPGERIDTDEELKAVYIASNSTTD
jgi:hypothetical protein